MRIAGVERDIAQIVLGTMAWGPSNRSTAFEVMDEYVALGGNALDTARIYGGGDAEGVVGEWMASRGNRDEMIVLAKGACTTSCTPELVSSELEQSLERLGTESADIYMMHRDNPSVPVGEFVDVLNLHARAGRVTAFGGSNWSTARIDEANRYAAAHGLVGFTVSSPNLSLARWNRPPWENTVSASDPDSRSWYERSGVALFAWSSQAGGFFTGRYSRQDAEDPALEAITGVWFNEANFARKERAEELARTLGVEPVQIALAYVLSQPFPVFALVGPVTVEELRSTMRGAEVELDREQLAYLALDEGIPVGA